MGHDCGVFVLAVGYGGINQEGFVSLTMVADGTTQRIEESAARERETKENL